MIKRYQQWLYPELRHAHDRAAYRSLMKTAWRRSMANMIFMLVYLTFMVIYLVVSILLRKSPINAIPTFIGAFALGIVPLILTLAIIRPGMRRAMRIELRRSGVPICVYCGYNTAGVDNQRCPECGRPILNPPLF